MLTASVKTTKTKIIGTLCVILAVFIAAILFFFGGKGPEPSQEAVSRHVTDNESRREFIASKWETEKEPSLVAEVQLPAEFDEVLTEYNKLQLASGMDITPYLGKTVTKYSYEVTNCSESNEVYATLYVRDKTVVAADIASHGDSWQRSIDGH